MQGCHGLVIKWVYYFSAIALSYNCVFAGIQYIIIVSANYLRGKLKMSDYGGFIYMLEKKEEAKAIEKDITEVGFFMDPLPLGDMTPGVPEMSLISLGEDAFTHASLMIPKREAGTIKHMMSFSNCISLPHISFTDISQKLGGTAWSKVRIALPASGRSERLNVALWEILLETLKELQPNIADELDNLTKLREYGYQERSGPGFDIMNLEKAMVGTFLDIGGFDRKQELRVQLTDGPAPFLKNLVGCKTLEEYSITHDMLVIGNTLDHFKSYQGGVIEYTKRGGGKLTVMNVNNADIEHTMGVDAVLYDHRYHSYLMIQCKRMDDQSAKDMGHR